MAAIASRKNNLWQVHLALKQVENALRSQQDLVEEAKQRHPTRWATRLRHRPAGIARRVGPSTGSVGLNASDHGSFPPSNCVTRLLSAGRCAGVDATRCLQWRFQGCQAELADTGPLRTDTVGALAASVFERLTQT